MIIILLSTLSYAQHPKGCDNGGDVVTPFAIYSPPSGIISVTTQDGQIYSFQYPPGTEHYRWGCYCNGWGIGYGGSSYSYAHNDATLYGLTLLSSSTVSWGPSLYHWRVVYRTSDYYFQIQHDFYYCPTVGALRVRSTVINTSGSPQTGVKFKRFIDWDVNPGYFSNNDFGRTPTMCYAASSDYSRYVALASLSPTPSVIELYGWDSYNTYASSYDYSSYYGDGYCLLDWSIGTLPSGGSTVIDACYVAGSSYSGLTASVSACATCPLGQGGDLDVDERAENLSPQVVVGAGGIEVKNYTGELRVFTADGRLVKKMDYRGGRISLHPGIYIVKFAHVGQTVVVR